jgi:signal transduction histidine kinase
MSERDQNSEQLLATIQALRQRVAELERAEVECRQAEVRLRALSQRLLAVQEAERRHLARELHDEIGQQLTCLRLALQQIEAHGRGPGGKAWHEALGLLDALLERVRALSGDLRPALLDQLGLLPALRWLVERFAKQSGLRVDFTHSGLERRFPCAVETAAYRIVQEGLTNVARHAGVSEAAVRVEASQDALAVRVQDRGAGFAPQAALASGRTGGLAGMQERARLVGGRLAIDAAPGRGTLLTAQLPLSGAWGAQGDDHLDRPGG